VERIGKEKRNIKQVLMDQNILSGIGNIYADEILFDSKISPIRKSDNLKGTEIENIYDSIKKILKLAIKERGSSVSDFRDSEGEPGGFAKFLKVYGKKKGKCVCCNGDIKTIKMGGRTAHYCPKCQK
jgi:formamidopyrimidine-DNA glycosylase